MRKNRTTIIPRDVCILVTEEDKSGYDILAMSDFFGGYVAQLSDAIRSHAVTSIVQDIPVASYGIIAEVIQSARAASKGTTQLIPDFDHLPKSIGDNLKSGKYKIGKSKQVNGNMRPVIVNDKGRIVKEITLKEVYTNPEILEASRRIVSQLQMRQISLKLNEIQELQNYQIDRDRDRDIKGPFLDARSYILRAQYNDCTIKKRNDCLEKASDKLLTVENSLYLDINTVTERLLRLTRFPIFQNRTQINNYIKFFSEDLQILTKVVGLRMQVLDYLDETEEAQTEMSRYYKALGDYFQKPLPGRDYSAIGLIHMNYSYSETNLNCWYKLSQEVKPAISGHRTDVKHIYLVSVGDQ